MSGGDGEEYTDEQDLHLSVLDELGSETGNTNVEGVGTVSVSKRTADVTGKGTAFSDADRRRPLSIGGATHLTLTAPYAGDTDTGLGYPLGGVFVGEPCEVRLPISLVKLDSSLPIV